MYLTPIVATSIGCNVIGNMITRLFMIPPRLRFHPYVYVSGMYLLYTFPCGESWCPPLYGQLTQACYFIPHFLCLIFNRKPTSTVSTQALLGLNVDPVDRIGLKDPIDLIDLVDPVDSIDSKDLVDPIDPVAE